MDWHAILVAVVPFISAFLLGEAAKLAPFFANLNVGVKAVIIAGVAALGALAAGSPDAATINALLMAIVQLIFPQTAAFRMKKGLKA